MIKNSILALLMMLSLLACNDDIITMPSQSSIDAITFDKITNDEALFLIQSSKDKMLYDLIRMNGEEFKLDLTERDRIYLDIDEDSYTNVLQFVETLNNNH